MKSDSNNNAPEKLSRLRMAEVVLDALLTTLVSKGVVTRAEVQQTILDQTKEDSDGTSEPPRPE